jgi:hypothetical protein
MSFKIFRTLYITGGAIFFVAAVVLAAALYLNGKLFLMPGPLSAMAAKGEALEGYGSHAEFEQSCGHCHAPVHCITDTRCQDCHMDVAKQRSEGEGLHARLPGTGRCQTCHIEHQGREMVLTDFAFANIDHAAMAGFSLDQHQQDYDGSQMGCESCHSQERFAGETLDCISCHSQEDHDYMAGHIETYGASCRPCHDGVDTMANFVHEEVYPLDGEHAEVECAGCHEQMVFTDTPNDCQTCHEKTSPYANMFGTACERCHTTVAWAPALLTQHTFSLTHGGEELLACESCHVGGYQEKSCYVCHEDHQPAEMAAVHLEVEVYLLDRCEECHPTGVEGEAERLRAQWQPLREAEAAWIEAAQQFLLGVGGASPSFQAPADGEASSAEAGITTSSAETPETYLEEPAGDDPGSGKPDAPKGVSYQSEAADSQPQGSGLERSYDYLLDGRPYGHYLPH